ncbi:MAG: hypothetical protein ABIZ04_21900 [Opitutus sp.]
MNILPKLFCLGILGFSTASADHAVTPTMPFDPNAAIYEIVRFEFKRGQTDGGFADWLRTYTDNHLKYRIVAITPLSNGPETSAVVVTFETPPAAMAKMTREEFDRQNKQPAIVTGALVESVSPNPASPRTGATVDPLKPRPRPQVVKQQQVRPAIFQENKFGTQNIGAVAFDAKWSAYGQYLQKLIETVQIQWERLLVESRVSPPSGTSVKVVFRLNSRGAVQEIVSVEGSAGDPAAKACASAITSKAPYGPWTPEMVAVLGDSQDLTFTFFYQ